MSGAVVKRLLILAALAAVVAAYFIFDLDRYLTLAELKASRDRLVEYYHAHPTVSLAGYFLFYLVVVGLSLPGAAIMSLAAGAVFGFWVGLVAVSFASSAGALLAFLVSRFVLRNWVRKRFDRAMAKVDRGVENEGPFYLFTLRLIPLFPFFVINLVMGLTGMRALTFYWVSQLGMLPGTAVFVNAGKQLGEVESVGDILSLELILSLALLGVFPLAVKRLLGLWRKHHGKRMEP